MGAVNTTYTFTATDTITSAKMNNIIDQTAMTTDAIFGTTLEVASGQLKVRSQGITSNELATGSVTTNSIADGTIVNADINAAAAIDLSKLGTGALPTSITIAPANFSGEIIPTEAIEDAAITAPKLDGEQIGTAPIYGVRAWVNFNGSTSADLGGTYSRTLTTVTVTASLHGLLVGSFVYLNFTGGSPTVAADGAYYVTEIIDVNSFKVTTVLTGASSGGTVSLFRRTIRASGNVSSVTYLNTPGYYFVNFAIPMPNTNYAISGFSNSTTSDIVGLVGGNASSVLTQQGCNLFVGNSSNGSGIATTLISAIFIG